MSSASDLPISSVDQLLEPFYAACKPESAFRVGTEAEKFGWLVDGHAPLPFEGSPSVQWILRELAERYAWKPAYEGTEGELIALSRGQASVTLEPAGQLELSGTPFHSIHETHAEFETHFRELHAISDPVQVAWLSLGFHPFATHADLPQVPKSRYPIMERYLPTRGSRALDMMRRTCTVQANLDYSSEDDAVKKLRVGLALQPIVTALFANSPLVESQLGTRLSERAHVWLHMDPDRSGILPFAWERDMSFRAYVEWALDVPMFLIKRGHHILANTEQTFRTFMREGFRGERATLTDWRTHLNTLFPEARLKNTLEMRGADAQSPALTCAVPALWKGLLYDARSLAQAESMISSWTAQSVQDVRDAIAIHGLRATLHGRPVGDWAADMVEIAHAGLERADLQNERGENETVYLAGLANLAREQRCPADALLTELSGVTDLHSLQERVVRLTTI